MSATKKRGLQKAPRVRAPEPKTAEALDHPIADQAARDDSALLVPISRIQADPGQPRRTFSEESIAELAADIRENGVINALTVTQDGQNYMLVAGERRLRALQLLGAHDAPVRVIDQSSARAVQLAENIHREDLPLMEEAQALAELQGELGLTVRQLAEQVRKSRSYVQRRLEVLKWPADVQDLLATHPGLLTRAAELAEIDDVGARKRAIAILTGAASEQLNQEPKPKKRSRGRPPQPFKFNPRRDGGFDLRVTYRPGTTNREDLITELKRLLKELEAQG